MAERALAVFLRTLGCKVNRAESEDIAADLLGRGVEMSAEETADVVVINTCTVTSEADAKARKAVRHALAGPQAPVVVVTGCLAALDAQSMESLGERVVVEADKERVADRVAEVLGLDADAPHSHAIRAGEGFRSRAALKVEDGCDNFCSYCIVPYARGVPRGVTLEAAVADATQLVEAGVKEIVLTGINLGRYRDGERDLADLVRAVAATGVARLRLSSIEPPDLSVRLLEVLAATEATCRHLHVPLQSGDDGVLRAMRRTYTAAEYAALVQRAREWLPGLSITTDVMVGFPAETDASAAETRRLCESLGFAKLHVFRYSARPGTDAASMPQIDPRVKAERASALREIGDALRARFFDARIGSDAELLVERVDDASGTFEGTTRDYVRVRVLTRPSAESGGVPVHPRVGSLVEVRLERRLGEVMTARIV